MFRRSFILAAPVLLTAAIAGSAAASTPPSPDSGAVGALLPDGCDPSEVTLTTKYISVGDVAMQAAKATMEDRYPGLTVETGLANATSYDELTQQVVADIAGGRDIDVVMSGNSQLRFYVDTYAPEPLDVSSLRDTYDTRFLDVGTVGGEVYMAPFQVSFPALFFNKDLFAEAGLDAEAPPTTFSELLDAAESVQEVSGAGALYLPQNGIADWVFQAAVQSAGGVFVNADGTPGFDTPEGRTGLALYADAAARGVMDAVPANDGVVAFTTGATAMIVTSIASTSMFSEQIGDSFDWGVVPMPVADGGSANYPAGGNGWLILTDDPCKAAIGSELIGELLSPEIIAEALTVSSYVPVDTAARDLLIANPDIDPRQLLGYEYEGTLTPWGGWPGDSAPAANQIVTDMIMEAVQGADVDSVITDSVGQIGEAIS